MITEFSPNLENFIQTFRTGTSGCYGMCDCGNEYFNVDENTNVWEDGELEDLMSRAEKTPEMVFPVEFSVDTLYEPTTAVPCKQYVTVCGCWIEEAETWMKRVDNWRPWITVYLNLEKKRMQQEAVALHTIEI